MSAPRSRLNLPRERHVQAVWPRARGWGRRRRARTRGAARESAILVEKIERFVVSKDTVAAVRPSLCRCQKARTDRFLGLNEVAVGSCLTAGRPARNWAVFGGQRQLDLPLSDGKRPCARTCGTKAAKKVSDGVHDHLRVGG